jgi:hypothetical protein
MGSIRGNNQRSKISCYCFVKPTVLYVQYEELMSKGNFAREDAVTMLTAHEGNVDAAFQVYRHFVSEHYVGVLL